MTNYNFTNLEENADPHALESYYDDFYVYHFLGKYGTDETLHNFLRAVIDEYGADSSPVRYTTFLMSEGTPTKSSGISIVHSVLTYLEEDYLGEKDDDCYDEEDEDYCAKTSCEHDNSNCCYSRACGCQHEDKNNDNITINDYLSLSKHAGHATIVYTSKTGEVYGCATDEEIATIKIITTSGKEVKLI